MKSEVDAVDSPLTPVALAEESVRPVGRKRVHSIGIMVRNSYGVTWLR
ncbi:hypothetical protein BKA25_001057 [Actinoalloteichus hymeniacidonis]|uniref:Uncharacterized protein n=1 Tax=Actinoalloteichus hymeniacidonis TaxID=340345 RepID=A0AAC9HT94_9PSEU|nr:hypothetical protein TL08_21975 [Actinoalloteichus hymeniacidonis]MBB5906741.1 hypothetical protein [Actinoalloteichus hymeniacidonis]